jgi:SAM-dependent methyltransferase
MNIENVNKDFYNSLYRRRSPIVSIIYSFISFDQQSKSKINFNILNKFLGKEFKNRLNILDYGFGHGSLLLKYNRRHGLFGCDISDEAVQNFPRVARLAGKKVVTTSVADFMRKFESVRFDVISLSHIIEHVDDDIQLVKSLNSKLSDNGVMLINVPINEVWRDPKHVRMYDISYLRQMLVECGLKIVLAVEDDKATSFFLTGEKVNHPQKMKRYGLKMLRGLFAVVPVGLVKIFERLFLKTHKNQQLIVLAVKNDFSPANLNNNHVVT